LKPIPLFSALGDAALAEVFSASRPCRYGKGSVVFHEGDPGDFVLLILAGRADVVLQNVQGQEVTLSVVAAPAILGYLALLDGAPRSATVVARVAVEARKLPREHFLELMAKHPPLLEGLLRDLATHLRDTNEQVRTALMFDIHGQVIRALMTRARETNQSHIVIDPRPTHQEIAQMIGKQRETVTRALAELKDGGYLIVEDKVIILLRDKVKRYWQLPVSA
jgi:CRP-like cAMP-binding protein